MTITMADLARRVQEIHGIDNHRAALGVVEIYVDQIASDSELWDAATRTLTDEGAHVVLGAIAASNEQELYGDYAAALLDAIAGAVKEIAEHGAARDSLIRQAMQTEVPRAKIAEVAGVSEARLYQIRNGR